MDSDGAALGLFTRAAFDQQMTENDEGLVYLDVEDVLNLHEVVVENGPDTEPGIANRGDVSYAVNHVRRGHFGQGPETIHETAVELMRLIVANHPFVDGNKRTALASTVALYAINGYDLDYDDQIRTFLKQFGRDESAVDQEAVREYLEGRTTELPEEYETTYRLLSKLAADDGQNGYDDTERNI